VHDLRLLAESDRIVFVIGKGEDLVLPTVGEIVSLRGRYLDVAMAGLSTGTQILVTFQGMGPKEKGRNPAAILKVQQVK